MQSEVEKIFNEICLIDDGFKEKEGEVKKIIESLLSSRPSIIIDEEFIKSLRVDLLKNINIKEDNKFSSLIIFNNMKKFYYLTGAAIIVLVIAIPFVYKAGKITPKTVVINDFMTELEIVKSKSRAFGSLSLGQSQEGNMGAETALMADSRPQGGGGGDLTSSVAPVGLGGGGGVVGEKMMIAPEMISYRFVYKGDEINLQEKEMEVLKRIKGFKAEDQLVATIKNMGFGLADLNSFENAKLQNLSIAEDRDFGYSVYIDFVEGMVNINENWLRWRYPAQDCRDDACFAALRMKESDILPDQDLITIADNFLKKYKISTDVYGEPEVDNNWRVYYDRMTEKMDYYIPESLSVVYPLMIDGKTVYDEGGMKNGLRVNINMREKIVSNAYGLNSRQYESSMYETETNADKILSFAERGGWNRRYGYYMPEESKVVDVEIGTPELSYVNMWRYSNKENSELIVPALVFPVLNVPDGAWVYEKNIIVPLASELLSERNDSYPYPILMKGEEGAVSGSDASVIEVNAVEVDNK